MLLEPFQKYAVLFPDKFNLFDSSLKNFITMQNHN